MGKTDEHVTRVVTDTEDHSTISPGTAVAWLSRNLDKILAGVISIVISIGVWFFSELRSGQAEISAMKQKIAVLEEKANHYATQDEEKVRVSGIEQEMAVLTEKTTHYATEDEQKVVRASIDNTIMPAITSLQQFEGRIRSVESQLIEIRPVINTIPQYEERVHTVESRLVEVTTTTKDWKETTILLSQQLQVKQSLSISPVNSR